MSALIKMVGFIIFGIVLQFSALFYYGTKVTDARDVATHLLDNSIESTMITVLYGTINGLIFFCIYQFIVYAIVSFNKKFKSKAVIKN